MPQVIGLQIAIEIHRYLLFGHFPNSSSYLSCYSCCFCGVFMILRCISIITFFYHVKVP